MSVRNGRLGLLSGLVAAVCVAAVSGAVPARAATSGALWLSPRSGGAQDLPHLQTSGACAAGSTVRVVMTGGTDLADGTRASIAADAPATVVPDSPAPAADASGGLTLTGTSSWADLAAGAGLAALDGTYSLTASCSDGAVYTGSVAFVGTDLTGATFTSPLVTSVAWASPVPSTVANGSAVPLSATVLPAGTTTPDPAVTGTLLFSVDGSVAATAPVGLDGVGSSSLVGLGSGPHDVTVAYQPDAAAVAAGVQPAGPTPVAVVTVSSASASVSFGDRSGTNPPSAQAGTSVVLEVTCSPADATGTVAFAFQSPSGTTSLGPPQTCGGGAAADLTWPIPADQVPETGTVVATFVPSDTSVYGVPDPAVLPFTVLAAAAPSATIVVDVPAGALSATVPSNPVVALGGWNLDSSGRFDVATGVMNPLTVIDSRSGDPGWTLTAQADDFVPCAAYSPSPSTYFDTDPSDLLAAAPGPNGLVPSCVAVAAAAAPPEQPYQQRSISAANLGIAAAVSPTATLSTQPGVTYPVNTGVVAAAPVQPGLALAGTGTSGDLGLRQGRVLVLGVGGGAGVAVPGFPPGSATGVAQVTGALVLRVPTVTVPGAYATTLTLTVS